MTKPVSYTLAIVVAVALIGPSLTYAEPYTASEVIDRLLVQSEGEGELTEEEKFQRAHEGLVKALSLTIEKIDRLTADLEGRAFEDGTREREMRDSFLGRLAEFRTYFDEKTALAETLGTLGEVQTLAQEIKTYREEAYTPEAERIVEFTLVFYSEDVARVANERLAKVTADIEKLTALGLIGPELFHEKIEEARALLQDADALRNKAREAILNPAPAPTITTTATTSSEVTATPAPTDATTTEPTPSEAALPEGDAPADETETETTGDIIETGLTNIKTAYSIFLEISKTVKETLGLQ